MAPDCTRLSPIQTKIADYLRARVGLDAGLIGTALFVQALRERAARCGALRQEAYWERLQDSDRELQELVEAVVVPETWFFRNRAAFAALTHLVRNDWMPLHPTGRLRVLSVPCSTGEEPYSIAMALLDSGLAVESFTIDAVDISQKALERAQQATYIGNSFRGQDLGFRDRYFRSASDGYHLVPSVRSSVNFRRGNLLDPGFHFDAGAYDVIFCRNMLIYFDRPAQIAATEKLDWALTSDGFLFVGPAEAFLMRGRGFVSLKRPGAFVFGRSPGEAPAPARPRFDSQSAGVPGRRAAPSRPGHRRGAGRTEPMARRPATPKRTVESGPEYTRPTPDLETARRLADAGRLAEAATMCDALLRDPGASAAAYYLSGLINDARGEYARAAECYRKALYLEPAHVEAAMQLSLLAQKQGDTVSARRLRERARRQEERSR